ncbi:MAG TPA: glycosyltransferase family 4 protein [Aggregatilineales bacterium]|nr:glycosyltransferase family 4 protein [Anaerolineales bacterium]HRE47309.1 glycosyltransferase family 4 protein [Aggregatilineales bacterium]
MKIVLLSDRIPPEHAGGGERVAWTLAGGLRDAGESVHVIAATQGAAFRAEREGIPTYHLHSAYPARWQAWRMVRNPLILRPLRKLLHEIQPDVLNAHVIHNHLSYAALTLAAEMGIPVVFTAHDVMPFAYGKLTHFVTPDVCAERPLTPKAYRLPPLYNLRRMRGRYNPLRTRRVRRILERDVQARIAVSKAMSSALAVNGFPPFEVVYSGIDPAAFTPDPARVEGLRAQFGLGGRRVILFGGRLSREKGVAPLLAALDIVAARVPNVTLLVLSNAPLPAVAPTLKAHLLRGGWLGGADLAAGYGMADVTVMPSICFESAGMMALESMAAGTPVVGSCFGGVPEIVGDGETGFTVNPLRVDDLAGALIRLLIDDDLRAQMGAAGQQRVAEQFLLKDMVHAIQNVFARVVGTNTRTSR